MRNVGHDSRGRSVAVSTLMILTSLVLGLLAGGNVPLRDENLRQGILAGDASVLMDLNLAA
jgi:hypothetical protein